MGARGYKSSKSRSVGHIARCEAVCDTIGTFPDRSNSQTIGTTGENFIGIFASIVDGTELCLQL